MSYALYEGNSRSEWERHNWISWQSEHARRMPVPDRKIVSASIRLPIHEIEDLHELTREPTLREAIDAQPDNRAANPADYRYPLDLIDLDWRNWDIFDYLSACGVVLMVVGFITAIFPSVRAGGALFPIGLGLMTLATYGARRRDTHST